jgi:malate/lactate dehydrogenase
MRRKVMCTASTPTGAAAALLLAQLDLAELVLLDAPDGLAADLAAAAGPQGYEPRVAAGGWDAAAGAEVVLLDAVDDGTGVELAARCSGAVVVVATAAAVADVRRLLTATRLPPASLFGIVPAGSGPISSAAHAVQAVDAVLRDRGRRLACAVLCQGESGEDGVRLREAHIGATGVQTIL